MELDIVRNVPVDVWCVRVVIVFLVLKGMSMMFRLILVKIILPYHRKI
jgi:hypothetical protein